MLGFIRLNKLRALAILTDLLPPRLHGTGFGLNMTGSRFGFTLEPIAARAFYFAPMSSIPFIAAAIIYANSFPLTYLLKTETKPH